MQAARVLVLGGGMSRSAIASGSQPGRSGVVHPARPAAWSAWCSFARAVARRFARRRRPSCQGALVGGIFGCRLLGSSRLFPLGLASGRLMLMLSRVQAIAMSGCRLPARSLAVQLAQPQWSVTGPRLTATSSGPAASGAKNLRRSRPSAQVERYAA